MKKYLVMFLVPLFVLLLSACSMHLGVSKIFKPGSSQPTKTKHIKATHTPPSPPTATPAGAIVLTPTPLARNQPNSLQGNNSAVTGINSNAHAVSAHPASSVPSS